MNVRLSDVRFFCTCCACSWSCLDLCVSHILRAQAIERRFHGLDIAVSKGCRERMCGIVSTGKHHDGLMQPGPKIGILP